MRANMGSIDRLVRVVLGMAIVAVGVIFKSWWGLIGIIPVMTAVVSWCPCYVPFGISTCKRKESGQPAAQ